MFGFSKKEKEVKARDAARRQAPLPPRQDDDGGDFATSMIVGMATDNSLIGYAAGGDMLGGMIGAALADTTSSDSSCSSISDSFSSDSSSYSCDSGGGCDSSGSCGD